jgi:hypothetical protein
MTFLERLGAALPGGAASLQELWDSLDENDLAGRLVVAHYLADVQEDVAEEVRWDELALTLVDRVTDEDLQALHPTLTVMGFVPSLQLNVADGYRRLGRFEDAAEALRWSIAYNVLLPVELTEQEAYCQMIVDAQQRVGDLLERGDSGSVAVPKSR